MSIATEENNASLVTEEIRASATFIYHGNELCQEKAKLLYLEMGLPIGFLSFEDIEEFGYVKDTGFVWFRQKNPTISLNEKIGKYSSTAREVTAFIEKFKIKKLTGVKGKQLLIWIGITEIFVDNVRRKATAKSSAGISVSYPLSAFLTNEATAKDVKS